MEGHAAMAGISFPCLTHLAFRSNMRAIDHIVNIPFQQYLHPSVTHHYFEWAPLRWDPLSLLPSACPGLKHLHIEYEMGDLAMYPTPRPRSEDYIMRLVGNLKQLVSFALGREQSTIIDGRWVRWLRATWSEMDMQSPQSPLLSPIFTHMEVAKFYVMNLSFPIDNSKIFDSLGALTSLQKLIVVFDCCKIYIDDEDLQSLRGLKQLRHLEIGHADDLMETFEVTGDGVISLVTALPNLEVFHLQNTAEISARFLVAQGRSCPRFRDFYIPVKSQIYLTPLERVQEPLLPNCIHLCIDWPGTRSLLDQRRDQSVYRKHAPRHDPRWPSEGNYYHGVKALLSGMSEHKALRSQMRSLKR
ncbi:hypothetical protein K470DRAFT_265649 [Piedraia hortae CBS 480.64]|uniref:F-box domain-containing protein n=1 Tax=Piedraia hortae CBS 480.64 TaxID=1314780 RepID=A0A6A7BUN2_9PEZI|nr:hypothetical protein K470DRAFT_265649 [Piedraia hortae CBS 480.64]